ncbi:hypothetical protein BIFBIF_02056 [Bifidobacterium bifidum ATCC 29521 = JCM 1255 = DSM 20456]|nr:hypothetical protein BIFBIF_02056 [Bifidobacterium bifidum ATCC 29521 = JCM 1255 = DSM 20456]
MWPVRRPRLEPAFHEAEPCREKSRRRRQYLVRPPQSPDDARHHPAARVRPGLRRPVSLPCYAYP